MTEIIIRLTPEQEDLIRRRGAEDGQPAPEGSFRFMRDLELYIELRDDLYNQAAAALALYDQLVTEAQAASDE